MSERPKYFEYDEYGELIPVYEKDALRNGRFVFRDGKTVRIGDGSRGPVHYAGSDDLGTSGVLNPATGKRYDSRAEYYRDTKAAGCRIVEPGETPKERIPKPTTSDAELKRDIATAIKQTEGKK